MAKTAVVALGGNALTREGQAGTYDELEANATAMAKTVSSLMRSGWRVVLGDVQPPNGRSGTTTARSLGDAQRVRLVERIRDQRTVGRGTDGRSGRASS